MKTVQISDGVEVYTRNSVQGYGYEIIKKTFVEKIDENRTRNNYQQIFHTYKRDLLKSEFEKIEKTKAIPETWPDTSKEVPEMKIFVFRSKHCTYHFDAQTPEKLEKACRKILKEESPYWPPDAPKNNSGIESAEELDKIGIETLRKEIEEKFNKYQKQLKQYNYNLTDWNNLQLVLEGKGTLRNALDALQYYEADRWDIVDLDEA